MWFTSTRRVNTARGPASGKKAHASGKESTRVYKRTHTRLSKARKESTPTSTRPRRPNLDRPDLSPPHLPRLPRNLPARPLQPEVEVVHAAVEPVALELGRLAQPVRRPEVQRVHQLAQLEREVEEAEAAAEAGRGRGGIRCWRGGKQGWRGLWGFLRRRRRRRRRRHVSVRAVAQVSEKREGVELEHEREHGGSCKCEFVARELRGPCDESRDRRLRRDMAGRTASELLRGPRMYKLTPSRGDDDVAHLVVWKK